MWEEVKMAQKRILTLWEVEEFIAEVKQRPSIWMGKDMLWVRRLAGENQFALKFVLEDTMYTLYVRVLSPKEREVDVERYVDWLLRKFTSYAWRKEVEGYLGNRLAGWGDEGKIREMAMHVCAPSSRDLHQEPQVPVVKEEEPQPPAKRSRYLEHLLKGTKK